MNKTITTYILKSGACPNCGGKLDKMIWIDGKTQKEIPWSGEEYRCADGCGKTWTEDEIPLEVDIDLFR
jgi:hypothetical protein